MWPFSRKAIPAVKPAIVEPVVDREEELEAALRQVCAELHELDWEALRLKARYNLRFDGLGQIVGMECSMNECAQVRAAWLALLKKITPRLRAFHEVQAQLATWKLDTKKLLEATR